MVAQALTHLPDAPADAVAAFVVQHFGVAIEPRFIPLFRATLLDRARLEAARRTIRPPDVSPTMAAPHVAGRFAHSSERAWESQRLALELLASHGLPDWGFRYNRQKCALGMCFYHRRTIELSIHFVERNAMDEIRDTILHEIAHALVGPGHGHDAIWKRKCRQIGARPRACGAADMPEGHWQAQCGGCGRRFHRHRRPARLRGWFCRGCGPQRGPLVWMNAGSRATA
jgi:predicted SprT family Zn-dependent metalloprotease